MSRDRGESQEIFLEVHSKADYVPGAIEQALKKQLKEIEQRDL